MHFEKEQSPDPKLVRELNAVGHAIDDFIKDHFGPDKIGFVVLMFDLDTGGRMNYLCNCSRSDMIKALEELVRNLKNSIQ